MPTHLPPDIMNQFTYGGALLVLMGGIMTQLKEVPKSIWELFVRQTTVTVTVKDDDPAFDWVKEWMLKQPFIKTIRRVDLDSSIKGEILSLIPAPGEHLFWRDSRPFWVHFIRSDEAKGQGWGARRAESFLFRTPGRKQAILEKFVKEVVETHHSLTKSKLFIWNDYWQMVKGYEPRNLQSVILAGEDKEKLLASAKNFLDSKELYGKLGIPYHKGYAFYGPPGTGKTSLVSALASELEMNIYLIDLSAHTDKSLKNAMSFVPEKSIILFEDIDASQAAKKRKLNLEATVDDAEKKKKEGKNDDLELAFGVTLSGLLNVLDGFHAPSSVIFVMTTNHIDALDPALLRPGRIDYKLLLGEATLGQKTELFSRFFPDKTHDEALSFIQTRPTGETMAGFQGALLERRIT